MKYVNDNGPFTGTIIIQGNVVNEGLLDDVVFHANITNGVLDDDSIHSIGQDTEDRWIEEVRNFVNDGYEFDTVCGSFIWFTDIVEEEDEPNQPVDVIGTSFSDVLEHDFGDITGLDNDDEDL